MDCVRESARNAPTVRTVFGGEVRTGKPVVTLTIIGICVVSWVLQLLSGGTWTQMWVFSPALGDDQPWRFLTAAFLHSTSPLHILFNMYALWIVGQYLEPAFGRARFLTLYLLAAVGGQVGVLVLASPMEDSWRIGVVGASGAIFGLFGAIFFVMKKMGRNASQILVLIAINLALPWFIPNLAWQAHVGGLIVGLLLGAAYAYAPRDKRQLVAWAAPVTIGVVLVGLTVWKYSTVPTIASLLGG